MKVCTPLLIATISAAVAFAGEGQSFQVRFSDDYPKAVEFYIDGNLRCRVPANPEGNNAYCDANASLGEHTVTAKGEGLTPLPCKFYIARPNGAYVNLTKNGHLGCFNILSH